MLSESNWRAIMIKRDRTKSKQNFLSGRFFSKLYCLSNFPMHIKNYVNRNRGFFGLGGLVWILNKENDIAENLATLGNFWPLPTKYANIIIKEVLRKVTHLLMAIFLLLARSKICSINFWIENDPPSPPLNLFQKFIRSGTLTRP